MREKYTVLGVGDGRGRPGGPILTSREKEVGEETGVGS